MVEPAGMGPTPEVRQAPAGRVVVVVDGVLVEGVVPVEAEVELVVV